jgi:hypothetical protein
MKMYLAGPLSSKTCKIKYIKRKNEHVNYIRKDKLIVGQVNDNRLKI